ncbi:MAG TPA: hypothetical protein VFF02_16315 [Anaeromyxobacteraceae bacterium]|nr:hypothetical protein [Anaeromyxobacteraceae bacterium]
MRRSRAAVAWALLSACGPGDPEPMPRVVGAWPTGSAVCPDEVVAAVEFSHPVDPPGVADGRFLALAREADVRAVTAAVEGPGGLGAGVPAVAAAVALVAGGRRAELRPAAPLDPLSGYALVVASQIRSADGRQVLDPSGRRRPFVSPFRTGPRPDRTPPEPRWIRPPHGPAPANLAGLRLGFDEPVAGALGLPGAWARPVAPSPQVLGLDLTADLPAGPLLPSLEGVADGAGNRPSELAAIEVRPCRDLAAPLVAEAGARLEAGETFLAVTAEADELVRPGLEVASPPGEICEVLPAWPATAARWSEPSPCPGYDPCRAGAAACPAVVRVDGLCPGARVAWRLLAEDLAGNRASPGPWREARTAPPAARPVLSEALVDAAAPEEGGEYAEVANLGTGEADLAGWRLAKRGASGAWTRCTLEPLGGPVPPGGHGLVVGGAYDGRYALAPDRPLFRCAAGALLGGLSNDAPPGLALEAPDGAAVSTLGVVTPLLRCGERSVERLHPAGPDEAANLACSPATPGTPGACNGATPPEECPRRPW